VVEALLGGGEEGFLAEGVVGYVGAGWAGTALGGGRGRWEGRGRELGGVIEPEAVEKVEEVVGLGGRKEIVHGGERAGDRGGG